MWEGAEADLDKLNRRLDLLATWELYEICALTGTTATPGPAHGLGQEAGSDPSIRRNSMAEPGGPGPSTRATAGSADRGPDPALGHRSGWTTGSDGGERDRRPRRPSATAECRGSGRRGRDRLATLDRAEQRLDGGTFGWSVSQRSTDPGRAPGGRPGRGAHLRASAAAMTVHGVDPLAAPSGAGASTVRRGKAPAGGTTYAAARSVATSVAATAPRCSTPRSIAGLRLATRSGVPGRVDVYTDMSVQQKWPQGPARSPCMARFGGRAGGRPLGLKIGSCDPSVGA